MKKFLALILALITLMSMMVIPSFAASKLPEVTSVKFIDDNALSLKEMTAYFDEMLAIYEEDDCTEMIEEEYFYINYAMFDYELEIALSDGNTIELSLSNAFQETDNYDVYADAFVSYAEYLEAKNNKAKTVDVEVSVTVDNTTLAFYGESVTTDFVVEKAVKNAYVLSILPLNFLPTKFYRNCDYFDLEGTKFLVTYSDLNTETLELSYDKDMYEYYLGDEYINLYINDDDELTFAFYDGVFAKKVIVEDEPFEKIEIKECDFDVNSKTLLSILTITVYKGKIIYGR